MYVRSCFEDALPGESTIREWLSRVDGTPGWSKHSFDFIASQVPESKPGHELLLTIHMDEMSIRKVFFISGFFISNLFCTVFF